MNMTTNPFWMDVALRESDSALAWNRIFAHVLAQAREHTDSAKLHESLKPLDRALAEAAWPLWEAFPTHAAQTVDALRDWWQAREHAPSGRAILILDALSLRELNSVTGVLELHGITSIEMRVTGAPLPTDTNHFAAALGLPTRNKLANDKAPGSFLLQSADRFTDVLSAPFADCVADIPARRDIVIWHSWPDDLLTTYRSDTEGLKQAISQGFNDPGFWHLINTLRQGRQLIITSDHGYATTDRFAAEEQGAVKDYLARIFGAMRLAPASEPLAATFMPPLALTFGDSHVVLGQRWWKMAGGYPKACHGGVSLLEAIVPCMIIPEAV